MTALTLPDCVRAALTDAVAAHVTPGGVVEVGNSAGPRCTVAAGRVTYAADAAPVAPDTIYDLASLTKVVAIWIKIKLWHGSKKFVLHLMLNYFTMQCMTYAGFEQRASKYMEK